MSDFILRLRALDLNCANCCHTIREHDAVGSACGISQCECLLAEVVPEDSAEAAQRARAQFSRWREARRNRRPGTSGSPLKDVEVVS